MADRFVAALAAAGLDVELRTFPRGTRTAADAAGAVGCAVAQIVKSLVFLAGGRAVVTLVGGADRVDVERLGAHLGARVVKADADAVRRETGYAIGGVPPMFHARPLRVVMDEGLLPHPVVWAAAGRPDRVFAIAPHRLRDVAGAELARVAVTAAPGS